MFAKGQDSHQRQRNARPWVDRSVNFRHWPRPHQEEGAMTPHVLEGSIVCTLQLSSSLFVVAFSFWSHALPKVRLAVAAWQDITQSDRRTFILYSQNDKVKIIFNNLKIYIYIYNHPIRYAFSCVIKSVVLASASLLFWTKLTWRYGNAEKNVAKFNVSGKFSHLRLYGHVAC